MGTVAGVAFSEWLGQIRSVNELTSRISVTKHQSTHNWTVIKNEHLTPKCRPAYTSSWLMSGHFALKTKTYGKVWHKRNLWPAITLISAAHRACPKFLFVAVWYHKPYQQVLYLDYLWNLTYAHNSRIYGENSQIHIENSDEKTPSHAIVFKVWKS